MSKSTRMSSRLGSREAWPKAFENIGQQYLKIFTFPTDLSTTVNQIFISKNDPYYRSPTSNSSAAPFFLCSVSLPQL